MRTENPLAIRNLLDTRNKKQFYGIHMCTIYTAIIDTVA